MSMGAANRRIGMLAATPSTSSGVSSTFTPSVSTVPGSTPLTVIGYDTSSSASDRMKPFRAAFEAP